MKKKIVLFGTGELADVVRFYLTHDSSYEVVAHTADREYIKESTVSGLPLVAFDEIEKMFPAKDFGMFVALSYKNVNKLRAEKYVLAKKKGYELISYVSSKATTWPDLKIGDNTFIFENNVIQPFAAIGSDVILWSGNHIGHHASIGDHCFLASHIVVSGGVVIEPYCFVGVNATLRDHITVRRECVIGAGSLLLKDTKEKEVYASRSTELFPKTSDQLKGI